MNGRIARRGAPGGPRDGRLETLVEIAVRRAREQPDALAYTFLADGAIEAGSLTFAQLDATARTIAAGLLEVAQPGDRALLVYEAGLDFVTALYGCLYAGLIAVPIPAPETSRVQVSLPRLNAVASDCGAPLLLGNPRTHDLLREHRLDFDDIRPERWIDTRELAARPAPPDLTLPAPTLEGLAYLQYTSGSTATPKGVMVSHRNVVVHLAEMCEHLEYDASSVSVSWMPHFHDYGLIEGVLLPLFNGTPAYLLAPFAFLKRPGAWLHAIGRYRGTHTQGPNFSYRFCARRVNEDQCAGLDLSSLRSAGNGGEPIHPRTSDEFFERFARYGLRRESLRPAYGLAEATLMVTATPMSDVPAVGRFDAGALVRGEAVATSANGPGSLEVAASGRPLPHTTVAIVDPDTLRRVPSGAVGEVWVASEGVAQGYWRRPDESERTFRACIAGESEGARYLRTGDLGFMHDGQLHITSRRKDLIIIRGLNHYPQDVEWTVQRVHPALRADHGAAFSIDVDGEERLCVVQELERGEYTADELTAMFAALVQAIGDHHGLALHGAALIRRGSIHKTSSGKVQRRACRDAFLQGSFRTVAMWPPTRPNGAAAAAAREVEAVERDATPKVAVEAGHADGSRERADAVIAWLRDYAEHRINSRLIDERRCVPPPIVLDFGNHGLFGLEAPRRYGGLALTHADATRVFQQLGAIDLTLATMVFLHNTNGLRPILGYASEQVRDQVMPLLATGRGFAAFALSEPGAGSNLGAVGTRATPRGPDGWSLYGEKRWNGSAWADVISVFARTVDGDGRARGFTGFVVRQDDPGVRLGPEALTMGVRGIMQNSLHLDDVRVDAEHLLGEPERGMRIIEDVLSRGRLTTAAIALGAAQRCAQLLLRYASRRQIETGILLHNPQAFSRIGELLHRIAIDREQLARCSAAIDGDGSVVAEAAMLVKVSATDTLNDAADLLMQLLGGRGYMENNIAPQILRDARLLSIGEGANESLIAAVGRSVRATGIVDGWLRICGDDGTVAGRLREIAVKVEQHQLPTSWSPASGRAWRDALLGRLAAAGLAMTAARTIADRTGDDVLVGWAARRFDRLCRDTERAREETITMIPPGSIEPIVRGYVDEIGDIEPLAADVDVALDPLLRRDPVPTGDDDVEHVSRPDRKREMLRRLIEARLAEREATVQELDADGDATVTVLPGGS